MLLCDDCHASEQVIKDMAIAWVLTIPAAAVIAYVLAQFAAFTHPVVAYACSTASVAGDSAC